MSNIELCGQTIDLDNLQSGYFNMDCMAGMAKFPDKYFDLAVVDPPYGGGGGEFHNNDGTRFGERFDRYKQPPTTEPPDESGGKAKHGIGSGDGSTDTSSQQNRWKMGSKVREKNHKLGPRTQRRILCRAVPSIKRAGDMGGQLLHVTAE